MLISLYLCTFLYSIYNTYTSTGNKYRHDSICGEHFHESGTGVCINYFLYLNLNSNMNLILDISYTV